MTMTKTQLIGGLFQDSRGNVLVNGYLIFKLNQDNAVTGAANIAAGIEITIFLNSSGGVDTGTAQYLWATDILSVPNAFYRVTGYTSQGQPAWGPNNQQVVSGGLGGGTFDVGLWVPNSVFSWTPPNQPVSLQTNGTPNAVQTIENLKAGANIALTADSLGGTTIAATVPAGVLLQTGGVNNGSQTKLNLAAGTGISIVDNGSGTDTITNTNPAGSSFSSPGKGFFIGSGMTDLTSAFVNTFLAPVTNTTANVVVVNQFVLQSAWTLSSVSYQFTSVGSAGSTANFGIYDSAGTKLIDSGTFDGTLSTVQTKTFSPVTLPPGVYYFAASATSTAIRGPYMQTANSTYMLAIISTSSPYLASAANSTSAGVMPATLGTLTAITTPSFWQGIPLPIWKV